MHYWNQDNFQSLLALADALAKHPDLALLAEYCRLREQGLRKPAFDALNRFLSAAEHWSDEQARRHVLTIVQVDARTPEAHQFMAVPLLQKLIYPRLEQWLDAVPNAVEPTRWLGLLRRDAALLRQALVLDPADVVVRSRLIDYALDAADHATHHLNESILLGQVAEVREAIALARNLIATAPDPEPFRSYVAEANQFEQMMDDWEAYQVSKTGTFPEWCQAKGRSYTWCTHVYYNA